MSEVADSYCERCGARYIFNPNAAKGLSLKGARVLAKGLKNFVLTDGQSMSDSIAAARIDDDHQDSSRLTEAFHRTFNFCLTCRQYACDKCWNVKVGACLTCAPEDGYATTPPQRRPLENQRELQPEPMFTPAPAADWDTSWSLFAEGSAEPAAASPAAGFNEPITFSEPAPKPSPAPAPAAKTKPAAAPSWPVADMLDAAPATTSGSNGKTGHRAPHKQADQAAASLWPIADEIAPEMTLTAEELELVESSLGQGETELEFPSVAGAVPEPPLFESPVAAWSPAEPTVEDPVAAWVRPGPAGEEPIEPTGWGSSWRTTSPSPWDNRSTFTADRSTADDPTIPAPAPQSAEPPALPVAHLPEPAVQPHHILSMPMASLASPEIHPPVHEPKQMVAKILGRHGSARRDQSTADAWPRPTAWSERPVKSPDWTPDEPPAVAPSPEPAISAPVPAAAFVAPVAYDHSPAQMLSRQDRDDADARSAAAVRLSAVTPNSGDQPIAPVQPPLFNMSPAASVPPQMPAAPEPPAAWPPLGASWPAQTDPGAPWPGPDSAPAPAAMAAQAADVPTLTEMWVQSSQEVLNRGTVRVCLRCALPVSTQARFCRRCGTRQG